MKLHLVGSTGLAGSKSSIRRSRTREKAGTGDRGLEERSEREGHAGLYWDLNDPFPEPS